MTITYDPHTSFITITEHDQYKSGPIYLDVAYFPTFPRDIALGEVYTHNARTFRTPLNWVAA